jgi:hypothetical protein
VPVAAIAREPRGIEPEHSADLPRAQGGDQAIEAGPFDGAASSASSITSISVNPRRRGTSTISCCRLWLSGFDWTRCGVDWRT